MKPTPLQPLRPSRRLFTVPACVRLRKLAHITERVKQAGLVVLCLSCLALITRMFSIGLVPV